MLLLIKTSIVTCSTRIVSVTTSLLSDYNEKAAIDNIEVSEGGLFEIKY